MSFGGGARRAPLLTRDSGPRILVTGAAGFIGFHLCRAVLAEEAVVVGVDAITPYYDRSLKAGRVAELMRNRQFRFQHLDLSDLPALKELFERFRPDKVVHLAAQPGVRASFDDPLATRAGNLDASLALLEACRAHRIDHLVYASSSSVYGLNERIPFRESDRVDRPASIYGASKRAAELFFQTYAGLFDLPTSGLRLFTAYGPWGRPDMAYMLFAEAIAAGRPIELYNYSNMQRDFTYVGDIVEAIRRLIDIPPATAAPRLGLALDAPHLLYNVGSGQPVALGALVESLERHLGRSAQCRYRAMPPGEMPVTYADTSRLVAVTGYAPTTSLDDGISAFADWFRQERQAPAFVASRVENAAAGR